LQVSFRTTSSGPAYKVSLIVVTAVKLKVHKYSQSVYCGSVIIPNHALPELARGAAAFTRRVSDPKMAMHLFCLDLSHAAFTGQAPQPGIMIVLYDANGEAHGRSDEGFGWALKIGGAVDNTRSMSFREANQSQGQLFSDPFHNSSSG
jgi:hypothetical protein